MKITVGINGVSGRIGQRVLQLAHEDQELVIGAALEAIGHPHLNRDAGEVAGIGKLGVPIRSQLPLDTRLDAMIDFSTPEGTMSVFA